MALTKDEFLENLYQEYLKQQELNDLAVARAAEEQALMDEYKIDELNQKRSAIVSKYQSLSAPIQDDLKTIRAI